MLYVKFLIVNQCLLFTYKSTKIFPYAHPLGLYYHSDNTIRKGIPRGMPFYDTTMFEPIRYSYHRKR